MGGQVILDETAPLNRKQNSDFTKCSFHFSLLVCNRRPGRLVPLLFVSLEKFSLDLSLLDLLSLGHRWSVVRYQGELEPWSVRLLIMWVYPAVLLAGIGFALARNRARKWLALHH